ncbi:hypothetical protein D3C81_1917920 [compost metagenome]
MHAGAALFLIGVAIAGNAGDVAFAPGVKALDVDEIVAQTGDGFYGGLCTESAEEQRVINAAVLHQLQQVFQQCLVVIFSCGEA